MALLRDRLPMASERNLQQLHALMLGGSPSSSVFVGLLKDGCSPTMIQSAMFDFRDAELREAGRTAEGMANCIRQVDRLGLLLLHAVADYWQGKLGKLQERLSDTGDALQMAEIRARWIREGEVTLYNYFREVPVMARVRVFDVRESVMVVERTPELVHVVAGGQHGRYAHIRLPDLANCLRLEVKSCVGRRVNLGYAGTFRTERERRQHIRVLCDDGLSLSLMRPEGGTLMAKVRDISQSGLGLRIGMSQLIKADERLGFSLPLRGDEVHGFGEIRWLNRDSLQSNHGVGRSTTLGLELEMSPVLLHRLQAEVAVRQKRILTELDLIGVPDSMA